MRSAFCVVSLDSSLFLVDPLNDHRSPVTEPIDAGSPSEVFHHTYIGQDTLRMIEAISRRLSSRGGRYLDCGVGAGGILLTLAGAFDEAIGMDINPRAVSLSDFNARLNGLDHVRCIEGDALQPADELGRFDLVTWNAPFIFMPDEHALTTIDGYGGELGVGLCLDFIEILPTLLDANGQAFVAAMSPILDSGENVLRARLRERASGLGLDIEISASQSSWAHNAELWRFHRSRSIDRFDAVYLHLRRGRGRVEYTAAPVGNRAVDVLRGRRYARLYG